MGKTSQERSKPNNDLLQQAMNALNDTPLSPQTTMRDDIFSINQEVVNGISKRSKGFATGMLRIKQSVHGNSEDQSPLPLEYSTSHVIDVSKIGCGDKSLEKVIRETCADYSIGIPGTVGLACCTPVVVAIPGMHGENDPDCTGTTSAEFVPVLSWPSEKHVLAICYSLSAQTVVKIDNLTVQNPISCIGRKSKHNSAFQAIEIPNLVSLEMKENTPELYDKLKNSACVVALVEYEIKEVHESSSYANQGTYQMRGERGISAHSVVFEGSQTHDNSSSISLSGVRTVRSVELYIVAPMVINTLRVKPSEQQYANIRRLMMERLQQLNNDYSVYKSVLYNSFIEEINGDLKPFGMSAINPRFLIVHTLLSLGSIPNIPAEYYMVPSKLDLRYFFVDLKFSKEQIDTLVTNLQNRYGAEFCEYRPDANRGTTLAVRFSLSKVMEHIKDIKKEMTGILQNPDYSFVYNSIATNKDEEACQSLITLCEKYSMSASKTDCVEAILLRAFDCKEKLGAARFAAGSKDMFDKRLNTYFYLEISEEGARQVVQTINNKFPNTAEFIRNNARVADKGSIDLMEIRVKNITLCSEECIALFSQTLTYLDENEPQFIERFQIESRKLNKSSKAFANDLKPLVEKYNSTNDSSKALSNSIKFFAESLENPSRKKTERYTASQALKRSIYFYQSELSNEELEAFKKNDKKTIKAAQKSLSLY